ESGISRYVGNASEAFSLKTCDIFGILSVGRCRGEQTAMGQLPLYAARITDLCPGHFVSIRRIACGQDIPILPNSLLHGLRLPPRGAASGELRLTRRCGSLAG